MTIQQRQPLSADEVNDETVHGAILRHRLAFDNWLATVRAIDENRTPESERAHKQALDALERAEGALLNRIPKSLFEASLAASHLIAHFELEHFDAKEIIHFLRALAIAPVDQAPVGFRR